MRVTFFVKYCYCEITIKFWSQAAFIAKVHTLQMAMVLNNIGGVCMESLFNNTRLYLYFTKSVIS